MTFFPDSTRLLLAGAEAGRKARLYSIGLGSGEKPRATSPEGVVGRLISPDGTRVAVRRDGNGQLWPLGGGDPVAVAGVQADESLVQWPDARELYVCNYNVLPAQVIRIDVTTGRRTVWKSIAPADRLGVTALAPNRLFIPRAVPDAYFYSYLRTLNELYVVSGVR